MENLTGFITQEWALWLAFFGILTLLVALELKEYFFGPNRLSPQQAIHMINKENAMVLDLRESLKFEKGHILDALHLSFTQLDTQLADLKIKKDRPLILVCDNDAQAAKATAMIKKQGFPQVFSIQGGLEAWQSASLPLTKAM